MRGGKVGAARVGNGGNPHASRGCRQRRQPLEPFDAGLAQRFGVGHHVGRRDRDEVPRAEIVADLDLVLDRPLRRRAELADAQRFLFGGQIHRWRIPMNQRE